MASISLGNQETPKPPSGGFFLPNIEANSSKATKTESFLRFLHILYGYTVY
jgi:hypothetical protein